MSRRSPVAPATPLEGVLRERIRRAGPLSFFEVMQAALYDPRYGYYTTLTRFDDFLTSPEVHPAFGWLLGRQALDVWHALEKPSPFRVLELGAGSGALAESLAGYLRQRVPRLEYAVDEPSPGLRATQQQRLADPSFSWASDATAHFVIANEVTDALPVHRVVVRNSELRELNVGIDQDDTLCWVEEPSVPAEVETYFQRLGLRPPEGAVAEVSTGLAAWTQRLAQRLEHGVALVLDYGYTAEQLFSRSHGTLLTYFRHTLGSDPLTRLGQQDISAHVDFTTLARAAQGAGLTILGVTSQRTLLGNLGMGALIDGARAPMDRDRLTDLVAPDGLGRIAALFLARGLAAYTPVGLRAGLSWPREEAAPRLHDDSAFLMLWREAFQGEEDITHAD